MPLTLGPVLQSPVPHYIRKGPKQDTLHQVMVTYGCATDDQKRPVFNQMVIDETYFVGKPSVELWVNSKLVGLCALEVSREDPYDSDPEVAADDVYYHAVLHAVILRKSKRRMGFAEHLCKATADLLTNQIHGFMAEDCSKACTLIVQASLVSVGGETFFFDMTDHAANNFDSCTKILGREVRMVLEAGF